MCETAVWRARCSPGNKKLSRMDGRISLVVAEFQWGCGVSLCNRSYDGFGIHIDMIAIAYSTTVEGSEVIYPSPPPWFMSMTKGQPSQGGCRGVKVDSLMSLS